MYITENNVIMPVIFSLHVYIQCHVGDLDYVSVNTQVIFPAGVSTTSFDVPILNDLALEAVEVFTVLLSSSEPNIVISEDSSTATVTITDIDSEWDIAVS